MGGKRRLKQWEVQSHSDPSKQYKVTLYDDDSFACSCPQWIYRRKECKHIKKYKKEFLRYPFEGIQMSVAKIEQFLDRLAGSEGCQYDGIEWRCGGKDFIYAKKILTQMNISQEEQEKFLEVCKERGGFCDCEILMNAAECLIPSEEVDISDYDSFEDYQVNTYESLRELMIVRKKIPIFPEWIKKVRTLGKVWLIDNDAYELHESIGNLRQIYMLVIEKNPLKKIPESFGNLKRLTRLSIKETEIKEFPNSVKNLEILRELDMRQNLFSDLPQNFNLFPSLTVLHLQENEKLEKIPESIGSLKSLKKLSIYKCGIFSLPESIENLKALEKVYIENNKNLKTYLFF